MSRKRVVIDERLAHAIRELHKHYPYLGSAGIEKLLRQEGIEVDPHELRLFMESHHIEAQPQATWRNSADPIAAFRSMYLGLPYPLDAASELGKPARKKQGMRRA
jgi:hypothetical protein